MEEIQLHFMGSRNDETLDTLKVEECSDYQSGYQLLEHSDLWSSLLKF